MSIALLGDRQNQFFQAEYRPKIQSWPAKSTKKTEKKKKYVIVVSKFKNKFFSNDQS